MIDAIRSHKPEWIYQLLPYLYMAAGVVTILALRNLMSIFSGGMLLLAGLTVRMMRKSHRKEMSGKPDQHVKHA